MSEISFEDPENKANLYEHPKSNNDAYATFEEAFAARHGGDPVEWIPEAEQLKSKKQEILEAGEIIAWIKPTPEEDGVFKGYHEVKVPLCDTSGEEPQLIVRTIYATPEQAASGEIFLPGEGLFAADSFTQE